MKNPAHGNANHPVLYFCSKFETGYTSSMQLDSNMKGDQNSVQRMNFQTGTSLKSETVFSNRTQEIFKCIHFNINRGNGSKLQTTFCEH
jgi:hypothetical protein